MATRVLKKAGPVVDKQELVNHTWYRLARHYTGPNFSGIWNFAYRTMLDYITETTCGLTRRQYKHGLRVHEWPEDFNESHVDWLRIEDRTGDIFEDTELCQYVLGQLRPRYAKVLRLIYIDGRERIDIAKKWQCSRWNVSLVERRALREARCILTKCRLLAG